MAGPRITEVSLSPAPVMASAGGNPASAASVSSLALPGSWRTCSLGLRFPYSAGNVSGGCLFNFQGSAGNCFPTYPLGTFLPKWSPSKKIFFEKSHFFLPKTQKTPITVPKDRNERKKRPSEVCFPHRVTGGIRYSVSQYSLRFRKRGWTRLCRSLQT